MAATAAAVGLWATVAEAQIDPTPWPAFMPDLAAGPSNSPVAAPLPPDLLPSRHDSGGPAGRAAFVGLWIGWLGFDRGGDARLGVERVTETEAEVVYAFGSAETGPHVSRHRGQFVGDELHLALSTIASATYRLRPDGHLDFLYQREPRLRVAGVLERVAPGDSRLTAPPLSMRSETLRIPMLEHDGTALTLEATLHRPVEEGRRPVIVFNHGSTGNVPDLVTIKTTIRATTQARFFVERGFAVIAAMRRGRGKSDGVYDERYTCFGADLKHGLERAIEDLDAVVACVQGLPWADADRIVVSGISRGGILSVAYAAARPGLAKAVVNFVGGWVGDGCRALSGEDFNDETFRIAGGGAKPPNLWLYGEKDRYYGADAIRRYRAAFLAAGGDAELHLYPTALGNGHALPERVRDWTPAADAFLARLGLPPKTTR